MQYENGTDLNAVILNGDFIAHSLTKVDKVPDDIKEYKEITDRNLRVMKVAFDKIRENVGSKVAFLPSIGNNDVPIHNTVPCTQE